MSNYIGKISALVTASTADLERKLLGSRDSVRQFGRSLDSTITSASTSAQRSLAGIFTPLQKIQRALDIGRNSRLELITEEQLKRTQRAVSVAEQINKPLGAAQRAFTGLSNEVAANFLPALVSAQGKVILLNRRLEETGNVSVKSFAIVDQSVQRTTAAIQRLAEAQQLLRSGPRGQELAFVDPQVSDALRASAASRQQAASLPATARGAAASQVANLANVEGKILEVQAKIERARLRPRVDATELNDLQQQLARYFAAAERIRQSIQIRVDAADAEARLREINVLLDALRADQAFRITGNFQNVEQAKEELVRVLALQDQLTDAQRVALAPKVSAAIDATSTGDLTAAKAATDDLRQSITTTASASEQQAERIRRSGEAAREAGIKIGSLASAIQAALGNASPTVDALEQDFRRLLGVVEKSPASRSFVKPLLDDLLELFTAARNGADNIDAIVAKLNELKAAGTARASGGLTILSDADVQADKALQAARTIGQARDSLADRLESGFGGAGAAGLDLGIDARQIRTIEGEFEFLQNRLSGLTADVRGPAVAAMERYRQVYVAALRDGSIATDEGRRNIAQARDEVVRLGAAATNTRIGAFGDQLRRAGDLARGFGSRFGLAIQQAVFAVDDFFSVSGGLDQQIRAAGNNISQLGFILGGTAGLFAGVAVSIGGQLAAAVIRYRNGLVEARDEAESLNKTLEAQRTKLSEVSEEFDSFIDDIVDSAFSEATRKANQFSESLNEIVRKLKQIEQESIASLDPDVIRERALQQSLQRRTGEARNVADILTLQAAIDASRQREQAATQRATGRGPAQQGDFDRIVNGFGERLTQALGASNDAFGGFNLRNFLGRDSFESSFGLRADSLAGVVQPAIGNLIDLTGFGDDIRRAAGVQSSDRVNQLASVAEATRLRVQAAGGNEEQLLAAVAPLREELDRLIISSGSADQGLVDFARGVRVAIAQVEASLASPEIREANKIFEEAARSFGNVGQDFERIREAAEQAGAGLISSRAEQLAEEFKAASTSLKEARAAGDPAAARQAAGRLADLAQQRSALTSATSSVTRFAAALDRASGQIVESAVGDARGAADQARRGANRLQGLAAGGLAIPRDADFAERQRQRQEEAAAGIEARAEGIRRQQRDLRFRFQQAAAAGNLGAGAQGLIRRRDAAQAVLDNRQAAPADRVVAENTIADVNRRLQQLFESFPAAQRLAGLADALDAAAQKAIAFGDAVEEGRNLVLTDAQRVADDFIGQVQKINAALAAGEIDQGQRDAAIARLRQDGLRQLAPTIFGLADQVQNAVLQGPSRAALQATDVSTVQGAQELNRLLRGDDAARDQPLIELQREANKIAERIARGVENNEAKLAN